jgi:cytochrome c5
MPRLVLCLLLTCAVCFWVAAAAEKNSPVKSIELPPDNAMAELRPGPGVDVARANCFPCHSTDYIVRQPRSDAKKWDAEVKKMIAVFGAPISDAGAKVIVNYLATAYGPPSGQHSETGPDKPAPPRHP